MPSFDVTSSQSTTVASTETREFGYDSIDADLREWSSENGLRVQFTSDDGTVSNYTGDELEVRTTVGGTGGETLDLSYVMPVYDAAGNVSDQSNVAVQDGAWYGLYNHRSDGALRFGLLPKETFLGDAAKLKSLADRQTAVSQDGTNVTPIESVQFEVRDWELPTERSASVQLTLDMPRDAGRNPLFEVKDANGGDVWHPWGHPDGAVGTALPYGQTLPDLGTHVRHRGGSAVTLQIHHHPAIEVQGTVASLPLLNYTQVGTNEDVWLCVEATAADGSNALLARFLTPGWTGAAAAGVSIPGSDLSLQDISGVVFDGSDLTSSNLFHATLLNASLAGAQVESADMRGIVVDGTSDLTVQSLNGVRLYDASADTAALPEGYEWVLQPNLGTYAAFGPSIDLSEADLTGVNAQGRTITGGSLHLARVTGGNFTELKAVGNELLPLRSVLIQGSKSGVWTEGNRVDAIATDNQVTTVTWVADGSAAPAWGFDVSLSSRSAAMVLGSAPKRLSVGQHVTTAKAFLEFDNGSLRLLVDPVDAPGRRHYDLQTASGASPSLDPSDKYGIHLNGSKHVTVFNASNMELLTPVFAWHTYNGYEYIYVPGGLDWTAHRLTAQSFGGELVSITTSAENEEVRQLLVAAGADKAWIGLNDIAEEAGTDGASVNWVWSDGTVSDSSYRNWATDEPKGDEIYVPAFTDPLPIIRDAVLMRADGKWENEIGPQGGVNGVDTNWTTEGQWRGAAVIGVEGVVDPSSGSTLDLDGSRPRGITEASWTSEAPEYENYAGSTAYKSWVTGGDTAYSNTEVTHVKLERMVGGTLTESTDHYYGGSSPQNLLDGELAFAADNLLNLNWYPSVSNPAYVTFTLDGTREVSGFRYQQAGNWNNVKTFDFEVSTDGGATWTLAKAFGSTHTSTAYGWLYFDLGGSFQCNAIRMVLKTKWQAYQIYLWEVQFQFTSPDQGWVGDTGPWLAWDDNDSGASHLRPDSTLVIPLQDQVKVGGVRNWRSATQWALTGQGSWKANAIDMSAPSEVGVTLYLDGTVVHTGDYTLPDHTAGDTWSSVSFDGFYECDEVRLRMKPRDLYSGSVIIEELQFDSLLSTTHTYGSWAVDTSIGAVYKRPAYDFPTDGARIDMSSSFGDKVSVQAVAKDGSETLQLVAGSSSWSTGPTVRLLEGQTAYFDDAPANDWAHTLSSADLHADVVVGASDFLLATSDTSDDLTSAPAVLLRSGNTLTLSFGAHRSYDLLVDSQAVVPAAAESYGLSVAGGAVAAYKRSGASVAVLTPQIRDWTVRGSYEYLYVDGGVLNWDQHRAAAQEAGGELASIADADENTFVAALVPAGTTAYIGLNDIDLEAGTDAASANWVWSDGSVSTGYRNFGGTDPTGVSEPGGDYAYVGGTVVQDVVRIRADDGTWADHTHEPQTQTFTIAGSYTTGDLVIKRFTQRNAYEGHTVQFGHEIDPRLRWLSNNLDDWMEVEFGQEYTVTGWETGHTNGSDWTIFTSITITFYDAQGNEVQTLTHSNDASVYDNRNPAGATYNAANKVHAHTFATPTPNVAKMRFNINEVYNGGHWGTEHLHIFGYSQGGASLEWHSRTAYGVSQEDNRYRPNVGLILALSDVSRSIDRIEGPTPDGQKFYGTRGYLKNFSMQGYKKYTGGSPVYPYCDWQTTADPDNPPAVVLQLRRETELHGIGFRSEWMLFTDARSGPLHNYAGGNNWRGADRTQMENRHTFPKRYRVSYRSAADSNETDHSGFVEIGTYDAVVPLWTHSVNSAYDFAADEPLVFDNDTSRYVTGNGDRLIQFDVMAEPNEVTNAAVGLVMCGGHNSGIFGIYLSGHDNGPQVGAKLWINCYHGGADHPGNFTVFMGSNGWHDGDLDLDFPEHYLPDNPTIFDDGQWRTVQVTYASRVVTVTVDGQLEMRFRAQGDVDTGNGGLLIGSFSNYSDTDPNYATNAFQGQMRNLAIYDTVDVGGSTVDGWERQYLDTPVTALQVKLELLESYDAIDNHVRVAQMTFLSQEAGYPVTRVHDVTPGAVYKRPALQVQQGVVMDPGITATSLYAASKDGAEPLQVASGWGPYGSKEYRLALQPLTAAAHRAEATYLASVGSADVNEHLRALLGGQDAFLGLRSDGTWGDGSALVYANPLGFGTPQFRGPAEIGLPGASVAHVSTGTGTDLRTDPKYSVGWYADGSYPSQDPGQLQQPPATYVISMYTVQKSNTDPVNLDADPWDPDNQPNWNIPAPYYSEGGQQAGPWWMWDGETNIITNIMAYTTEAINRIIIPFRSTQRISGMRQYRLDSFSNGVLSGQIKLRFWLNGVKQAAEPTFTLTQPGTHSWSEPALFDEVEADEVWIDVMGGYAGDVQFKCADADDSDAAKVAYLQDQLAEDSTRELVMRGDSGAWELVDGSTALPALYQRDPAVGSTGFTLVGGGANLTHVSIPAATLTNVDLVGGDVDGCDLSKVTFNGTAAHGMTGTPAAVPTGYETVSGDAGTTVVFGPSMDYQGADLRGITVSHSTVLQNSSFAGADLRGARVARVMLAGTELLPETYAMFEHQDSVGLYTIMGPQSSVAQTDISDLNLSNAYVEGAVFDGATLNGTSLVGAGVAGASFASLSSAVGLQAYDMHTDLHHTGTFEAVEGLTYTFEHPEGMSWGLVDSVGDPYTAGVVQTSPTLLSWTVGAASLSLHFTAADGVSQGQAVTTVANAPSYTVGVATKLASHPHSGSGSNFAFDIDGVQAASLPLFKGLSYTFDNGTNGAVMPLSFSEFPDGVEKTFAVTVAAKTAAHPNYGSGSGFALIIDGSETAVPTLTRGVTYLFDNAGNNGLHPFRISIHPDGRSEGIETPLTDGFSDGDGSGVLRFTVPQDAPAQLYYYCGAHLLMGGALAVQDQAAFEVSTDANHVTTLRSLTASQLFYHAQDSVSYPLMGGGRLEFESPPLTDLKVTDDRTIVSTGSPPTLSGSLDIRLVKYTVAAKDRFMIVGDGPVFGSLSLEDADLTGANLVAVSGGTPSVPAGHGWRTDAAGGSTLLGPSMDLSGAQLLSQDVTGLQLQGTTWSGARAAGLVANGDEVSGNAYKLVQQQDGRYVVAGPAVDLGGSQDLSGCNFDGLDLSDADFTGATLNDASMVGCTLGTTDLSAANSTDGLSVIATDNGATVPVGYAFRALSDGRYVLVGPNLTLTTLAGADLNGLSLQGSDLSAADLTQTKTSGLVGTPASLPSVELPGSGSVPYQLVSGAIMGPYVDLSGFDFTGVTIPGGVDLAGATLPTGLQWAGALIGPGLDLTDKTVSGSMVGVDLRGSTLTGFKAYGVTIDGTEELDAGFAFLPDGVGAHTLVGPGVSLADHPQGLDISGAEISDATTLPTAGLKRAVHLTGSSVPGSPANHVFVSHAPSNDPSGTIHTLVGPNVELAGASIFGVDATQDGVDLTAAITLPTGYAFVAGPDSKLTLFGPGVDLRLRDLTGYDASAAAVDLSGAQLEGATFGAGTRLYNLRGTAPASLPNGYAFISDDAGQNSMVVGDDLNLSSATFVGHDFDFSGASLPVGQSQLPPRTRCGRAYCWGPTLFFRISLAQASPWWTQTSRTLT